MDRVTIQRSGTAVDCRYAAPSITTGRFIACVGHDQGYGAEDLREMFTDPGDLSVHNLEGKYADKTYSGYTDVDEVREGEAADIVVLSRQPQEDENNEDGDANV